MTDQLPPKPPWHTPEDLWLRLKPLARQKRHEPTPAEDLLWQYLRKRRMAGIKFRRQHPIERFIVDFYAYEDRLVIEVDGPIHQYQPAEDAIRQDFIESRGITVLRFTNEEVLDKTQQVLHQIRNWLTMRASED